METFIIYVFKSGFSLSAFYLIYFFFLRKETLFAFNRFYLLISLMVSLLIPFTSLQFNLNDESAISPIVENVVHFRNQSEVYWNSFLLSFNAEPADLPVQTKSDIDGITIYTEPENTKSPFVIFTAVRIIYMLVVLVFLLRFILRLFSILRFIQKSHRIKLRKAFLVKTNANTSTFSFWNYLVVNTSQLSSEDFRQVKNHELVHMRQWHSFDALLAELYTIIHWFHPFAWLHRSAIRENHEFLADKGATKNKEKDSYQETLIKQLISSYSFELANFFNLKPFKNRIYMMKKTESKKKASLKVVAAIPLAALMFLLFANLTINKNGVNLMNSQHKSFTQVQGVWELSSKGDYAQLIQFEPGKVHIFTKNEPMFTYNWEIAGNQLSILPINQDKNWASSFEFAVSGNNLTIWWDTNSSSVYKKVKGNNTVAAYTQKFGVQLEVPKVSNYSTLEKDGLAYTILIDWKPTSKPIYYVEGEKVKLSEIVSRIQQLYSEKFRMDAAYATGRIIADKNMPMKYWHDLSQELRKANALKLMFLGVPDDNSPEILRAKQGLMQKLPPLSAEEPDMDKAKEMFGIMEADIENVKEKVLEKFIRNHPKYLFLYTYKANSTYGDFVESSDKLRTAIAVLRNEYAMEKFNMAYSDLGEKQQQEVKQKYPTILTYKYAANN